MTPLARVTVEHRDELPVVTVHGEIDASNTAEIRRQLHGAVSNRAAALVVDLTPTGYLDSAGINLLFELGAELRDRQQRLHLALAPATPIARMLDISGLAAAEATHGSLEEAIESARAGAGSGSSSA